MGELIKEGRRAVEYWRGPQDVRDAGLFIQIKKEKQASIHFHGDYARFLLNPDPVSSEYVASRISEIDSHLDVEQRVKRWQPIAGRIVTARFSARFSHEQTDLTYNLMLWNAPFKKEVTRLATSIGVTRSVVSDFEYAAVIAQNVMVDTQTGGLSAGVLRVVPLQETADWLRLTRWHWIYLTVAEDWARIEVQQEDRRKIVAEEGLVKPVEALGFVFSVDNEFFPGRYKPVTAQEPQGFDMAYFEVQYSR